MLAFRVLAALISLSLLGVICTYVYRRLVRDVTARRALRIAGAIALLSPIAAVPLIRLGFATGSVPAQLTLMLLGLLGFVLFTMMSLVAIDVVRWVAKRRSQAPAELPQSPERRLFLSRAVAVGALTAGGGSSVYGMYRAMTPPEVTEVPVKLPGLPKALDGFTIVQLTDPAGLKEFGL